MSDVIIYKSYKYMYSVCLSVGLTVEWRCVLSRSAYLSSTCFLGYLRQHWINLWLITSVFLLRTNGLLKLELDDLISSCLWSRIISSFYWYSLPEVQFCVAELHEIPATHFMTVYIPFQGDYVVPNIGRHSERNAPRLRLNWRNAPRLRLNWQKVRLIGSDFVK